MKNNIVTIENLISEFETMQNKVMDRITHIVKSIIPLLNEIKQVYFGKNIVVTIFNKRGEYEDVVVNTISLNSNDKIKLNDCFKWECVIELHKIQIAKLLMEKYKKYNFINSEFSKNGIVITRGDYESLPCPLCAKEFTDEQMNTLADNIANILSSQYGYNEYEISCLKEDSQELEDYYNAFWKEMEECAVAMGMRYYEDMSDEEYEKIMSK